MAGGGAVFSGICDGARIIGRDVKDTTVDVVEHKHGDAYAQSTSDGTSPTFPLPPLSPFGLPSSSSSRWALVKELGGKALPHDGAVAFAFSPHHYSFFPFHIPKPSLFLWMKPKRTPL